MTFMMTATPLAMIHHGHSLSTATLGIQWHILAMYAPAFITGRLISHFGPRYVCASGLLLTACAAAVSMIGTEVIWFWGGLILLGVGWNFGFVSATVMLSACYTHQERLKVQSLNDSFVFGTTALASLLSGQMMHILGWFWLNMLVFIPVVIALGLLFIQGMAEKKRQHNPALAYGRVNGNISACATKTAMPPGLPSRPASIRHATPPTHKYGYRQTPPTHCRRHKQHVAPNQTTVGLRMRSENHTLVEDMDCLPGQIQQDDTANQVRHSSLHQPKRQPSDHQQQQAHPAS